MSYNTAYIGTYPTQYSSTYSYDGSGGGTPTPIADFAYGDFLMGDFIVGQPFDKWLLLNSIWNNDGIWTDTGIWNF